MAVRRTWLVGSSRDHVSFAKTRRAHIRLRLSSVHVVATIASLMIGARGERCGIMQSNWSVTVVNPDDSGTFMCNRLVMTNCTSVQESVKLCPEECPFLEISSYFSCGAACVTAAGCGAYRPAYSLPNPATRVCEKCPSTGCSVCDAKRCIKCRHGFEINKKGRCEYDTDWYIFPVYWTVGVATGISMIVAAVFYFIKNENCDALVRGLQHRQRCIPHMVESLQEKDSRGKSPTKIMYTSRTPLYPLYVDVHNQNIVGVGLSLYYNHLIFIGFVGAASFCILSFAEVFLGLQKWSVTMCGYGTDQETDDVVVAFARRRCLQSAFLWATLMPASLVFARWQASASRTFDRVHTRMEDYVLSVRNLPPDATNPLEIQAFFEKLLGRDKIVGVSIGYRITDCYDELIAMLDDHLVRREEDFAKALGVPTSKGQRWRQRNHRLPTSAVASSLPAVPESGERTDSDPPSTTDQLVSRPTELLKKLRNGGEAFLVMRREEDVETVFALWEQPNRLQRVGSFLSAAGGYGNFLRRSSSVMSVDHIPAVPRPHRMFRGRELELREVTSEPTSVVWQHMGTQTSSILKRSIFWLFAFLGAVLVFNFVLFFPLSDYVVDFATKAGQPPTTLQMTGLSAFMAASNSFLSNGIWWVVPKLGFRRKDQADIVVFATRAILVLSNTIALSTLTARKLAAVTKPEKGIIAGAGEAVMRQQELGMEVAFAKAMFDLFLRSTFIFGLTCGWILYPMSYVQALFSIKTGIFVPPRGGLDGSKLSTRDCEHLLEPMEIWLPWDYACHIQMPCCAFAPLLLAEPSGTCASRTLCGVLVGWVCFQYLAQRIIHLRASKETFFTTSRLDTAVLYAWGVPLAQLALTAAYWMVRASTHATITHSFDWGAAQILPCVGAFCGSLLLYWVGLYKAVKHQKNISFLYAIKAEPYEAALARLRYSYFNTNPVYVLMSDLCPEMRLPHTTWYEAGKAFLQADDPKGDANLEASLFASHPGPESQSMLSRWFYSANVLITGASQDAYNLDS